MVESSSSAAEKGAGQGYETPPAMQLQKRRRIDGLLVVGLVAVVIGSLIIVAHTASDAIRLPLFYDEMWRVDFIRSAQPVDRMLTHNTPVPIGFVWVFDLATTAFSASAGAFRALSAACIVAFAGVVYLTLARISTLPAKWGRPTPPGLVVAAATALALPMLWGFGMHYDFFNNYPFETLYLGLLVYFALEIERRGWAWWGFLILTALAPATVLAPLFVLPVLLIRAFLWANVQAKKRIVRLAQLAGAGLAAIAIGGATYLFIYEPVTAGGTVGTFWWEESLSGGLGDLPARAGQWWDGMAMQLVHPGLFDGGVRTLVGAIAVVGFAVGAAEIGRRWPWYLLSIVSGLTLTIPAALFFGWPVTAVRTNLAVVAMIYVVVLFGVFRSVEMLLAARGTRNRWLLLVPFALILLALWPPRTPPWEHLEGRTAAFSRGLDADIELIADSPSDNNLVLTYHYMSHFYADDTLINTDRGDRDFIIVGETQSNASEVFEDVDRLIAEHLKPGGYLWCVKPFNIGPEGFDASCKFEAAGLVERVRVRGTEAEISGYEMMWPST